MPHVSVIIPAYNQAQYLGDAIQSVLDQSYNDYEIIVIDDGSTDNTREVVAHFGDQVRYIWQENQGLGGARNIGIRAARGEFIGLLDSDDQWLPAFLETMISLTTRYPETAVYYCGVHCIDVDGRDLPQVTRAPIVVTPGNRNAMYQTLLRANFLIPSTVVMRRSVVIAVGMFEQTLRSIHGCEDWDLWLRIAPEYDFVGTSAHLVRYRLHGNSLSTDPTGMQRAVRTVIDKHFGPDDGLQSTWSGDKQRAYGGVYRYHALTSVQRQKDWQAGGPYLRQALQADPTLATNLTLFYDLALGAQPQGHRGTSLQLNLENNAAHISRLLTNVFDSPVDSQLQSLRRLTYGTAYYALGLVAYNTGQISLARRFLFRALRLRPELWRDRLVVGNLAKSFVGQVMLDRMKNYATWLKLRRERATDKRAS